MSTGVAPVDAAWIGRHPLPQGGVIGDARVRIGVVGGLDYPGDAAGLAHDGSSGCEVFALDSGDGEAIAAMFADPSEDLWIVLDAAALPLGSAEQAREHDCRGVILAYSADVARLAGRSEAEVTEDPVRAAQQVAVDHRALVVLRGTPTIIAHPDGRLLRYEGPIAHRTDVLAGLIGGLICRGASPIRAAAWAVWMHGEARLRMDQKQELA